MKEKRENICYQKDELNSRYIQGVIDFIDNPLLLSIEAQFLTFIRPVKATLNVHAFSVHWHRRKVPTLTILL